MEAMNPGTRLTAWSDLQLVRERLRAEAAARAVEHARAEALRRQQQAEREWFARAVGPVRPLRVSQRVQLAPEPVAPLPVQKQRDEAEVMREAISDEFDVETLLHTDDCLSYSRPGLGPDVVRKLREGRWAIQRHLDLHGHRTDEARDALGDFIRSCHLQGLRCVRVVHGKGLGSPGREPVLKRRVLRWLVQKREVQAFVQARPAEGGAGALVVLLSAAQD